MLLYVLAAKYIMGSNQLNGVVSKLSGTTKAYASDILHDPGKMENIIGMVRTFAPLTSVQTVSKVNTYLPVAEKVSTLLGMYSFLNRAQNYRPIQTLDAKNPMDKITALMKNGNLPVSKLIAQPLLANNMDKIMSAVAMNMVKNGDLNHMLSSLSGGANNSGLSNILSSLSSDGKGENTDISSLMETFMPMINNIMSSSEEPKKLENKEKQEKKLLSNVQSDNEIFKIAHFNQDIDDPDIGDYDIENTKLNNKPQPPPSVEKNIKQEKQIQRPIRIRQRRRPYTQKDS